MRAAVGRAFTSALGFVLRAREPHAELIERAQRHLGRAKQRPHAAERRERTDQVQADQNVTRRDLHAQRRALRQREQHQRQHEQHERLVHRARNRVARAHGDIVLEQRVRGLAHRPVEEARAARRVHLELLRALRERAVQAPEPVVRQRAAADTRRPHSARRRETPTSTPARAARAPRTTAGSSTADTPRHRAASPRSSPSSAPTTAPLPARSRPASAQTARATCPRVRSGDAAR